jgi:hypothetical protein
MGRVKWGLDGEGSEEEYFRMLERERDKQEKELAPFFKSIDDAGGVDAALAELSETGRWGRGVKGKGESEVVSGSGARPRQIHLSDEAWFGLQRLAGEGGFVRGSNPNVRAFLEDLGRNA